MSWRMSRPAGRWEWGLFVLAFTVVVMPFLGLPVFAQEGAATEQAPAEELPPPEPPPLPLITIEGTGGVLLLPTAYIVNPPRKGDVLGLPSVAVIGAYLGHGRNLEVLAVTQAITDRVELSYAVNRFDTGDLQRDVMAATGLRISDDVIYLHNFNARVVLIKENSWGQTWLPALTFGVHYKFNQNVDDIDSDLLGTLGLLGIDDDSGWDFTLSATKMLTCIPNHPVILTAGLRSTEAAHAGLLGFTGDRETVVEASVIVLLTSRLALGVEYRQKPDEYTAIPGLIDSEDDWWSVDLAYVFNNHATATIGWGHFGDVLNHEANTVIGARFKYEF